ncbi:MAG: 50S ribosomal protein L9 [Thermodesulfobacteriota bacterium]
MKVIFIDNVKNIGTAGEIKDVKNGLARNYLIPQKLAVEASDSNLKIWEKRRKSIEAKQEVIYNSAKSLAENLEGLTLEIAMKSGEEDKLFGSVTSQIISDLLAEKGFEISRKDIALDDPIKTLGTHQVTIKIHKDVNPEITINVISEEKIDSEKES